MKRLLFTFIILLYANQLFAQKIESSFGFHTGLMHFSGPSAQSTSFLKTVNVNYTDNPYGTNNGFGVGINVQVQAVTKKNLIMGLQIGTEVLRNKIHITEIKNSLRPFPVTAEGISQIKNQYFNINPFIGLRLPLQKINFDIIGGFEVGYVLRSYEEGDAISETTATYKINNKMKTVTADNRVKIGLAAHYDRIGITANYSHGLTNYPSREYDNNTNIGAHTEILRFGISLIIF